jgi:hypothetical protein
MWALGRRTALFIVSYAPLAAMFLVLRWPSGWSSAELAELALWLGALALGVSLLPVIATLAGRNRHLGIAVFVFLVCCAVVAIGALKGWPAPMTLNPPRHRTSAAAAGISFFACIVAVMLVIAILANAERAGRVRWDVTDPQDQGTAAATYLATYLLPLLNPEGGGWRLAAAYSIYLITLYIVFIRSDSLLVINPTLYIFGFRVSNVEVESADDRYRRRVLLLMKGSIEQHARVTVVPLGDNSYLARKA